MTKDSLRLGLYWLITVPSSAPAAFRQEGVDDSREIATVRIGGEKPG